MPEQIVLFTCTITMAGLLKQSAISIAIPVLWMHLWRFRNTKVFSYDVNGNLMHWDDYKIQVGLKPCGSFYSIVMMPGKILCIPVMM